MVERPTISLSEGTTDEIFERRSKESNRSEYIREALALRFALEDLGVYETVRDAALDDDPETVRDAATIDAPADD